MGKEIKSEKEISLGRVAPSIGRRTLSALASKCH